MIRFNSKTMERRIVNTNFTMACEKLSLVFNEDEEVTDNCVEITLGDEVWVFVGESCDKGKYGDEIFCYFPRIDYATTVMSSYIG
ncbi:hypothetical protein VPH209E381_0032 [Vibrio phage 209E38-1]